MHYLAYEKDGEFIDISQKVENISWVETSDMGPHIKGGGSLLTATLDRDSAKTTLRELMALEPDTLFVYGPSGSEKGSPRKSAMLTIQDRPDKPLYLIATSAAALVEDAF
ncbi:MAG: hypothetical protein KY445_09355 [Armatimonadetes bacterium]|nr:hypothetical protein [Armatimonadota bacterium]